MTATPGLLQPRSGKRTWEEISAFRHEIVAPVSLPDHSHDDHELLCAGGGTVHVSTLFGAWHLAPGTALWIPAGQVHAMAVTPPAELTAVYFAPSLVLPGQRWALAHALVASDLLLALARHLEENRLDDIHRGSCADVLLDVLLGSDAQGSALPLPRDPRAAEVTAALLEDPADGRDLSDWARKLRVSTKTLARAFSADTSLTFTQWRTRARIAASLAPLSRGGTVAEVARDVGYGSAASFIGAFRSQLGMTPGAYARQHRN